MGEEVPVLRLACIVKRMIPVPITDGPREKKTSIDLEWSKALGALSPFGRLKDQGGLYALFGPSPVSQNMMGDPALHGGLNRSQFTLRDGLLGAPAAQGRGETNLIGGRQD